MHAERRGYNGIIHLSLPNLAENIATVNTEIPAGTTDALLTLEAVTFNEKSQKIVEIIGEGQVDQKVIRRVALRPESVQTHEQPWLRGELAYCVTDPSLLVLDWRKGDPGNLALGTRYVARISPFRPPHTGLIRLTLMTSQILPKTPQPQAKDD